MAPLSGRTQEPCGLLLVGHGTRDECGRRELVRTAELVARRARDAYVEHCFLELARPAIAAGVQRLVDRGAARLTVAPLLLFGAGHAKRDIPLAVRQAIVGTPFKDFDCARHLGCHPLLEELSRRRYHEAVDGLAAVRPEESLLLLVGRGAKDREATAEMRRFAELRGASAGLRLTRTAFLAMARPSLDEALAEITSLPVRRVVVQPHLLFHGDLLSSLQQRVQGAARRQSDQQWIVTQHLGPSDLLADAIWDRCLQARSGQGR